jgi:hypothetical protein
MAVHRHFPVIDLLLKPTGGGGGKIRKIDGKKMSFHFPIFLPSIFLPDSQNPRTKRGAHTAALR